MQNAKRTLRTECLNLRGWWRWRRGKGLTFEVGLGGGKKNGIGVPHPDSGGRGRCPGVRVGRAVYLEGRQLVFVTEAQVGDDVMCKISSIQPSLSRPFSCFI